MDNGVVVLKLVVVGKSFVGKSSLIQRWVQSRFNDLRPTVGLEYSSKSIEVRRPFGKVTVKVIIWDTAGQERYNALKGAHYRNTNGALLVFDLTNHESFLEMKHWLSELRSSTDPNVKIVLVGNKMDLEKPVIEEKDARAYAKENGCCDFFAASAKFDINVNEAFQFLVEAVMNSQEMERVKLERATRLKLEQPKGDGKYGCC